jgi:hypothetical protein
MISSLTNFVSGSRAGNVNPRPGDYTLERIVFENGVDMAVTGILLIPKGRTQPAPAIVGLHGHGSSKESICTDPRSSQLIGPLLVKKGYVVAAIDTSMGSVSAKARQAASTMRLVRRPAYSSFISGRAARFGA